MAHPTTPGSKGAWSSVIIALATAPNVDFGTLYGLIRSIPNVSQNLCDEAVEVVALRCLEGIYDPVKMSKDFRFDSCERSVHVLQLLLEQAKLKNVVSNELDGLRKSASDQLLKELHAFIKNRKAKFPRCALQELRNSLHHGGASLAAKLDKTNGVEAQNSPDKTNKLWEKKSASSLQSEKDYTMLDVCIKCKEGDEVLTCNTCRMVVHVRCLGYTTRIYSKGDFMCPVCALSSKNFQYIEVKKNLHLALEDLLLFTRAKPCHGQLDQSKVLSDVNAHSLRQGVYMDGSVKVTSSPTSNDKKLAPAVPYEYAASRKDQDPVDSASKDQQEGYLVAGNADSMSHNSSTDEGGGATVNEDQHLKGKRKLRTEHFDDAGLHKGTPKKQLLHAPPKIAATCPSPKPSRSFSTPQKWQRLADQVKDALSSSLGDHDRTPKEEIGKAVTSSYSLEHQPKQKPAQQKNASRASHRDPDGNLEGESCRGTSNYSRSNQGNGISIYDVSTEFPRVRRQRILFTEEEVNMLKEGVKRFGLQWTAIFDFGCKVFIKGRTPEDLRLKWRNLVLHKHV